MWPPQNRPHVRQAQRLPHNGRVLRALLQRLRARIGRYQGRRSALSPSLRAPLAPSECTLEVQEPRRGDRWLLFGDRAIAFADLRDMQGLLISKRALSVSPPALYRFSEFAFPRLAGYAGCSVGHNLTALTGLKRGLWSLASGAHEISDASFPTACRSTGSRLLRGPQSDSPAGPEREHLGTRNIWGQ
jgi:hypothetical protein